MVENRISWHPGFLQALQLEFEDALDFLTFEAEHQLTAEPLRIDVLIIKKEQNKAISNPLAGIFRTYNLFEFKSITDTLSVGEFHKGLIYVLMYAELNKLDIQDCSLSFVEMRYPKSVIKYVREVWKCTIVESPKGMYEIDGLPFPVQIIDATELSDENHLALKSLQPNLTRESLEGFIAMVKSPHRVKINAFIDIVVRANKGFLKEALMEYPTLEEALDEIGITARVEARVEKQVEARVEKQVEQRRSKEIAQKLIQEGLTKEQITRTTGLDLSTVESLMGTVHA